MKYFSRLTMLMVLLIGFVFSQNEKQKKYTVCISSEEIKLFNLINNYRAKNKLPPIKLSKALTFVAKTHAKDLEENHPDKGECNMHSWSDKGNWKAMCYTPDHKNAKLMWSKPRELTNYSGDGFEIAHTYSIGATAESALSGWKSSKLHNQVILNEGVWKDNKFKSLGIGIYKKYAVAWFGFVIDDEGKPDKCK